MPPSPQPIDTDHLLSPHQKSSAGAVIGIIIILILLVLGALYFLTVQLQTRAVRNQVSYIPSGTTTVIITR